MDQDKRNQLVFWLIIGFIVSWVASEAIDTWQRQMYSEEIHAFMDKGGRFTAADGDELRREQYHICKRVQHLERQHHDAMTLEECPPPGDRPQ